MVTGSPMSGLQFDALPYEEGRVWELLEGDPIEVSSPTPRHQKIVFRVLLALRQHLLSHRAEILADVEFALSPATRLRPDVCVLLADKASALDPDVVPIPGAPDLAIEVISPTERASESHEKVRTYLRNGTTEVWQLFPRSRTLEIHSGAETRTFDLSEAVESRLLPEFSEVVATFFD
jgi:Uma2 family endonuclease